jgi:hypothetical protein
MSVLLIAPLPDGVFIEERFGWEVPGGPAAAFWVNNWRTRRTFR